MTSFPKLTAAKGITKPEWKYASDTAIENKVLSVSSISLNAMAWYVSLLIVPSSVSTNCHPHTWSNFTVSSWLTSSTL
jgi:hypothetical protein